ncbi:ribosomal protein S18-alanine N-acetyltransferase [Ketobacter nezhaii]|uniref:ribosomal protein S18-alanine N-acetyltransferase n=1 Tax=Ketobacter sp. MCCC 1A13808 TaxID=2602738 RepID=UPI0018DDE211|nr:ribosomal protein S18-alanine N-acetyltransferase [Ketobacter sp. MCCC 1A13808]
MQFQLMSFSHLPLVMEIEQQAYPWPWTEGMFVDSLRNGHLCYVALEEGVLVGYAILYVAVGECHILNICVSPRRQNQGLGQKLLEYVLAASVDHGAEKALLEVRPSNVAAVALYQRAGFEQVGVRKDYYPAGSEREDALVFTLPLGRV